MGRAAITDSAGRWRRQKGREPYHDLTCGLDYVYLLGGYYIWQTPHGESISFEGGLARELGRYVARRRRNLRGQEVRYLRKEMELTQVELGRLLFLSYQQVARWEKDICTIPGPADMLLRSLYLQHIGERVDIRTLSESIEELPDEDPSTVSFRYRNGWYPVLGK